MTEETAASSMVVTDNPSETLLQMIKFNRTEDGKLLTAKMEEVKQFKTFFDSLQESSDYWLLLEKISELDVSDLTVSTDAHGSLDAILAPILASGAFKAEKENVRMGYVKISDFLGDDEITLLSQEEFDSLSTEKQLEYFPIFDLDFSDNDKTFVFNGDALDGGKFSINVFLTLILLLRKQQKLIKEEKLKGQKFFYNFGNHELFALFNMLAIFSERCEAMLPGFTTNFFNSHERPTKEEQDELEDRRRFYAELIGSIMRHNFDLFDFCKCREVGSQNIRISHSIILSEMFNGIMKSNRFEIMDSKNLSAEEKQSLLEAFEKEFKKYMTLDVIDYNALNTSLKTFLSSIILSEHPENIQYFSSLCALVMASKDDMCSSKFCINLEGFEGTYKLTEAEQKLTYLIGHTIYTQLLFERVLGSCIVPMDFGASEEYKKGYEPIRNEPCPRITLITKDGHKTIQIPLPVLKSEFTKPKVCYVTCLERDGKMSYKTFEISPDLFKKPEDFIKELQTQLEKFGIKIGSTKPACAVYDKEFGSVSMCPPPLKRRKELPDTGSVSMCPPPLKRREELPDTTKTPPIQLEKLVVQQPNHGNGIGSNRP